MKKIIDRKYLEIKSISDLVESKPIKLNCSINRIESSDFQINKFFYRNVGKNHSWTDRLNWTETDWIKYTSDPRVETYILNVENDLAGYFELIIHLELKEIEIAYFGLLQSYHQKKLGSYLLSSAIKKSLIKKNINRVWVHTCTLDHENALKNYLARGMKIYKKETIKI